MNIFIVVYLWIIPVQPDRDNRQNVRPMTVTAGHGGSFSALASTGGPGGNITITLAIVETK